MRELCSQSLPLQHLLDMLLVLPLQGLGLAQTELGVAPTANVRVYVCVCVTAAGV